MSEVSSVALSASVRANDHGRDAADIRGQACGNELAHRLVRRHQHLAAHVAALLRGRQLVFEVHAGGAGLDHLLHELEGVQHAAKARLRVARRWA